jgi:hypothetical protein
MINLNGLWKTAIIIFLLWPIFAGATSLDSFEDDDDKGLCISSFLSESLESDSLLSEEAQDECDALHSTRFKRKREQHPDTLKEGLPLKKKKTDPFCLASEDTIVDLENTVVGLEEENNTLFLHNLNNDGYSYNNNPCHDDSCFIINIQQKLMAAYDVADTNPEEAIKLCWQIITNKEIYIQIIHDDRFQFCGQKKDEAFFSLPESSSSFQLSRVLGYAKLLFAYLKGPSDPWRAEHYCHEIMANPAILPAAKIQAKLILADILPERIYKEIIHHPTLSSSIKDSAKDGLSHMLKNAPKEQIAEAENLFWQILGDGCVFCLRDGRIMPIPMMFIEFEMARASGEIDENSLFAQTEKRHKLLEETEQSYYKQLINKETSLENKAEIKLHLARLIPEKLYWEIVNDPDALPSTRVNAFIALLYLEKKEQFLPEELLPTGSTTSTTPE